MSVILRSIKRAWGLLSVKGSRTRLILSGILLCLAFVLPMMLGVYIPLLIFGYSEVTPFYEYLCIYVLALVSGALVTLPAAAMFFTYNWQVYSNARYGYADRERKKGSYNYFCSLFAGVLIMARPFVCFVLFQIAYEGAYALSELCVYEGMAIPMIVFLVPFFAIAAVISVIFLMLTSFTFLVPYYYGRGMKMGKAISLSFKAFRKKPFTGAAFFLIFAAMSALSLISVGVLFVLLVLPLMMFTYFTIAEHIDGNKLLED